MGVKQDPLVGIEHDEPRGLEAPQLLEVLLQDEQARLVLRAEHGYPVYDLGFEAHLETVETYLDRFTNLYSTGRQGAFAYPNMHGAMRMGRTQ